MYMELLLQDYLESCARALNARQVWCYGYGSHG